MRMIFIIAIAITTRVAFLVMVGPGGGGDSQDYFLIAQNLRINGSYSLEQDGLSPTIRRPPGYPFFLAAIGATNWSAGHRIALVQAGLDIISLIVLYRLAREVVSCKYATLVALWYALYPGMIEACSLALSESVFTLLLMVASWLTVVGLRRDKYWLIVAAGITFGMTALVRPFALAYPPVIVISLLIFAPNGRRPWRQTALLLSSVMLTITPWLIRCYHVSGRLVVIQGASAVNWYVPTMTEIDQRNQDLIWPAFGRTEYGRMLNSARNPAELLAADRIGFQATMQNIRADVLGYVKSRVITVPNLVLNTFGRFTPAQQGLSGSWRDRNFTNLIVAIALFVTFSVGPLLISFLGLPMAAQHPANLICTVVWLATIVLHIPMWIEYRFFLPVVPFLCITTAVTVNFWIQRWRSSNNGSLTT
jgi:4-amino-4-deoxy-L-arabinose transferase-like glycosyltransferase